MSAVERSIDGRENSHYSNKGGHLARSIANKDIPSLYKLGVSKGDVAWRLIRGMRRVTQHGKR